MGETKKRLLLISVMLIFMLFASYNIGAYMVHQKYNKASVLNEDISELLQMIHDSDLGSELVERNPEIYFKILDINDTVSFLNGYCFDEVTVNE